jgi:hypothetical protein
MAKFRVTSGGLNLRRTPEINSSNILLVLSQGQIVTRVDDITIDNKFYKVRTEAGQEGFASKSFLAEVSEEPGTLEKVLWVIKYPTDDAAGLNWFVERATFVGATAVAIRTKENTNIEKAIPKFHDLGIKVYGWRWPSAEREKAMVEARKVVDLYNLGLDGYYVDPEGSPGDHFDWDNRDRNDLDAVAKEFCKTITSAAPDKPFGTTSHFRAKKVHPNLPWQAFFDFSTVLLPQAYWESADGVIFGGQPEKNYNTSIDEWSLAGGSPEKIMPMAGELEFSTAAKINKYVAAAKSQGKNEMHFYAANKKVPDDVWNAIKQSG